MQHIIFASTERVLKAVERMGLTAYYHPHLGDFSAHQQAAGAYADDVIYMHYTLMHYTGAYADDVFGVMMWLKTFSVYIALEAGADVLFQDVDNVWNEVREIGSLALRRYGSLALWFGPMQPCRRAPTW